MSIAQLYKYIPLSIILTSLSSVVGVMQLETGFPFADVTLWWLLHIAILFLFFKGKKYFTLSEDIQPMKFISWYLLWIIICFIRGMLIAEIYWDWKGLIGNTINLMVPIIAYTGTNLQMVQRITYVYLRKAMPLFIVIIPFVTTACFGYYLVPISFLMLFFPVLKFRNKILVSALSILVIFIDFTARSNVIKFVFPIVLMMLYYVAFFINVGVLEKLRKLLFIVPFVLLFLGISNIFNVFKIDEYIQINQSQSSAVEQQELTADTRTGLYIEVLNTALKYNTWIFGRSPARGNETELFADLYEITGRGERISNEVSILNIFTWTGLIGVILYLSIFYQASYLAINKSNNFFSKILGIYIAFRWDYAWVEDFTLFSLTTVFLWLTIGLCYSKSFRGLTDKEVRIWINSFFSPLTKINKDREVVNV